VGAAWSVVLLPLDVGKGWFFVPLAGALLAPAGVAVVAARRGAPAVGGSAGSSGSGSAGSGGAGGSGGAQAAPVQLSTATLEQLDTLPGVGPVTAQKILDYRTKHGAFQSVDELDAVPGIGPKRLEQLRDLVVP